MENPAGEGRQKALPGRRQSGVARALWGVFGLGLALVPSADATADAADLLLTPHRALYEYRLGQAREASGVVAVGGRMAVEYVQSCDGWTTTVRSVLDILRPEGPAVSVRSASTSFESANGLRFRFKSDESAAEGGQTETEGNARLTQPGGAGRAEFVQPRRATQVLPAGTLFPVSHSRMLVAAAISGRNIVPAVVFDGVNLDGALQVNAVIGPVQPPLDPGSGKLRQSLAGHQSWPVQLAYFDMTSQDAMPEYEISGRMFDNGVVDRLVLDYGDFTVIGELAKLEVEAPPGCVP